MWGNAVPTLFQRRQRRPLVARARFIYPHMHFKADIMSHLDGRQGRTPMDRGDPDRVSPISVDLTAGLSFGFRY